MRVATIVLALGVLAGFTASLSAAADARQAPATLASNRFADSGEMSAPAMLHSYYDASALMGFAPATRPPLLPRATHEERYHPAQVPLPATRTPEDHVLTAFVAVMLIAYQLRRKHRVLRPHRFGI